MALGEALAVFIGDQRAMMERRGFPAKCAVNEQLAGGALEQVLAANNFGDAHVVIVGHHGQLVTGHIVVTPKHEVAKVPASGERLR